ncbi:MAG: hypothetical protein K8R02_07825 [Anaerohalosphaeraceae bacterium]|nr:hypothetical protein [Anaerohalosphaeraceae bacterium]
MIQISLKKILLGFLAIFLMSRGRKIVRFLSELEFDGVLTLKPLRDCSEEARYLVTIALLTACFVIVAQIFRNYKK